MPQWFQDYLASGHLTGTEPAWFTTIVSLLAQGHPIPTGVAGIDGFYNWIADPANLAQLQLLALVNAPAAVPAPAATPVAPPAPAPAPAAAPPVAPPPAWGATPVAPATPPVAPATQTRSFRVWLTNASNRFNWPLAIGIIVAMLAIAFIVTAIMNHPSTTGAGNIMPSPTPTATVTPSATPTASPSPTATPTPAPTSTPTPAPTATPTATPSASQPPADDQTGGKPLGTESQGCVDGLPVTPDHTPSGEWTIPCDGMYRAINYWNKGLPKYDRGQGQSNALLICYDQHVVLHGNPGGSQYQWTHWGTALGNFQRSVNPQSNPEVKLSDLVAQGLATVTVNGGGVSVCDGGTPANAGSSTPPAGNNGGTSNPPTGNNPPAMQDGCTTTNKQGTFSEFYGLGKNGYTPINEVQRIEVAGFSGWSEMDYYTLARDNSANGAHRVPTINYVFPPREAMGGLVPIWFGNGSAWNYGTDNAQCNKDYALSWAKYYASQGAIEPGRLDNGNSGVVVDMQSCMLYNTRSDLGWNRTNIQQLLDAHRASMTTTPCTTLVDSQGSTVTYDLTPQAHDNRDTASNLPSGPDNNGAQCGQTRSDGFDGNSRKIWTITTSSNEVAVVNYWNNLKNPNPFYKFLLEPGSKIKLVGGGDVTFFPASCANSDVVQNGLHKLNKAKGQKLVDVRDIPSKYKR